MKRLNITRIFLLTPLLAALEACTLGPDYVRPATPFAPATFKEMKNWKLAQPNELAMNGKWWEMFNDAQLNALVEQVNICNQNLAVAEANFRKAMALVQTARADLYPTLALNAGKTRYVTIYDRRQIDDQGYLHLVAQCGMGNLRVGPDAPQCGIERSQRASQRS